MARDGLRQVLGGEPDPVAQVLDPARHVQSPHVVTEVALDLAGDRRHRVTLEGVAELGVVAVDGLDQSERRDLAQVLGTLAAVAEAAREPFGHRQPGLDDLGTECVAPLSRGEGREPAECLPGVGGVVVRMVRRARLSSHGASQLP